MQLLKPKYTQFQYNTRSLQTIILFIKLNIFSTKYEKLDVKYSQK